MRVTLKNKDYQFSGYDGGIYIDVTISLRCNNDEALNNIMRTLESINGENGLPFIPDHYITPKVIDPIDPPKAAERKLKLLNKVDIVEIPSNSIDSLEL